MAHIPVLQKEVLKYLDPKPNENFIDCTVGEGGHSVAILERIAPRGKVLGIDLCLTPRIKHPRLILVNDNFVNLKNIVEKYKFKSVQGILFDLGMSSWHLEESGRGFSFKRKEPLDMRYDKLSPLSAEKILNFWSKFEIEKILREYGEEKKSRRLAEIITKARKLKPLENTLQLRKMSLSAGANPQKVFQALRIAVNDELENLRRALPQAVEILAKGGRLVVISFHSLEDRIVKNYFREKAGEASIKILTKKPITPSVREIKSNPRARSAKLRAIIKN